MGKPAASKRSDFEKVVGGILGHFYIKSFTLLGLSMLPDGNLYTLLTSTSIESISLLLPKLKSTGLWAAPEFILFQTLVI